MDTSPTTVYYNSACPVCDAGICFQKKQMQGCAVEFVDVHTHPEVADQLGIDLELLRERLHVLDAAGHMQVGDRAFTTLWAQTRGQRWLARLAPPFYWLTGPLYRVLARLLYRWNRHRANW